MSGDRITDLYEERIGTPQSQMRARQRVHWMCRQVEGDDVLDIGCSQGIVSLLLGREGARVLGVDVDSEALAFATERLGREEPAVRDRVEFRQRDAADLEFEDASFDTVVIGEVLEHLIFPERVLAEAARVVKPEGRVVLTIPYGLFAYPDHKESIYLTRLLQLTGESLRPIELELIDYTYVGVVLAAGEPGIPPMIWERAVAIADERLAEQDLTLQEQRSVVKRHTETIKRLREKGGPAAEQVSAELSTAQASLKKAEAEKKKESARSAALGRQLKQSRARADYLAGRKAIRIANRLSRLIPRRRGKS